MPSRPADRIQPEEIIEWRRQLGWSQERAAAKLGVVLGTYRNWEQGQQRVSLPNLLRGMMKCLKEHR